MRERLALADLTEEEIRKIAKTQRAKPPTSSRELPEVEIGLKSVLRNPTTLRHMRVVELTGNHRIVVEDIGFDPTHPIPGRRSTIDLGQQNVAVYADWEVARLQPVYNPLPEA